MKKGGKDKKSAKNGGKTAKCTQYNI